ncbi:hypothetical protein H106_03447 [Trichophyton rubrum CBS 735.88]|uniref:Uncharacterized protein n=1 Tax=Trichophyton violaceum TaxID=34388 RepID=A0A178FML9_TRIVO|nr:hypothetical protein H106_03447 [Trichophyton rubrum CBS 735.88]OAL72803.1 hypothetical protein A7D00_2576 [Trichophyton violaceum]
MKNADKKRGDGGQEESSRVLSDVHWPLTGMSGSRDSCDSDAFILDDFDYDGDGERALGGYQRYSYSYSYSYLLNGSTAWSSRILRLLPPRWRRKFARRHSKPAPRLSPSGTYRTLRWLVTASLCLTAAVALLWPSYTHRPAHYNELKRLAVGSETPGRGNPRNEKVFIAANIYDPDGSLAQSQWSRSILQLIDLLGPENSYLSIYENDMNEQARGALQRMADETPCNHSMVTEEHLDTAGLLHITLPDGSRRLKRISFLAEVRNRALRPINQAGMPRFDKILYVNDVFFDPVDALQLLLSTNLAEDGGATRYRAACAVDFINPFKFYDTFASRDLEGYSMGLPFFPWFTTAGNGQSRRDVLSQSDAVRVRSCWGGMVAFDAKYFQHQQQQQHNTTRFRAEPDLLWEASECCLVHADIQDPPSAGGEPSADTGIYVNPYIRVAYSPFTLSWLGVTRRFERLFSLPHDIINRLVGMPWHNPRRTEKPGDLIEERTWVENEKGEGSYQTVTRAAGTGGFCGNRALQVMKPHPQPSEKTWELISPDMF